MPALNRRDSPTVFAQVYTLPSQVPPYVKEQLLRDQEKSNILLPGLEKASLWEEHGDPFSTDTLWISVFTRQLPPHGNPSLDFFLACTDGPIGKYPIFIYTTRSLERIASQYVQSRMACLVSALVANVDTKRVFSIFALHPVAVAFANEWASATGITYLPEPYYAAKFSACTPQTFRYRSLTKAIGFEASLRPAQEADIEAVATLCHGFAAESEPFVLSMAQARQEASNLTANQQVWVYEVTYPDRTKSITSIVAFTREAASVSAITKVYTAPAYRKRGMAERLVREVCRFLFRSKQRQSVVLYVAHNNPAAAKVYHKVGFVGLDPEAPPTARGVDSWTEFGFDPARVELGHW